MIRTLIFFVGLGWLVSNFEVMAQVSYDQTDFRAPLNIDLLLAGNFAELRSNHFHTGLDIKTKGVEGYRIYAIDLGYISRINISHYGYGKAMYVTHPNGYTSVYAHLSRFPDEIEKYVRKKQFSKESETLEIYPSSNDLVVSKGDVIAYSGNSGSSSAPHLHFEIRETDTERPVNPLLFGFDIKDDRKPVLSDIKLYPLNGGIISEDSSNLNIELSGSNGNYYPKNKSTVKVLGEFGVAINTVDYLNGASNKCGIYTIELKVDSTIVFKQKMEKLNFSTNRYINTQSDYLAYRYGKQSYHKSFVGDNNKLDIYKVLLDKGHISFTDTLEHKLTYTVKDVYGNTSTVAIKVKTENPEYATDYLNSRGDDLIKAKENNIVEKEGFVAILPRNTVYEDLKIDYATTSMKYSKSDLHQFHNDSIPIHKYFVLKLKTKGLNEKYKDKAVVVEVSKNKHRLYAKGGKYEDGWIETKVRSFGDYAVRVDSVAPKVQPINISDGKYMANLSNIQFKISDNLSGIDFYAVYVDDQWKLANYNTKKGTLIVPFDDYNDIEKGKHSLRIVVRDERRNQTTKTYSFTK